MKRYLIIVDGLKVGIMELSPDDVKSLLSDNDIKLMEV